MDFAKITKKIKIPYLLLAVVFLIIGVMHIRDIYREKALKIKNEQFNTLLEEYLVRSKAIKTAIEDAETEEERQYNYKLLDEELDNFLEKAVEILDLPHKSNTS